MNEKLDYTVSGSSLETGKGENLEAEEDESVKDVKVKETNKRIFSMKNTFMCRKKICPS